MAETIALIQAIGIVSNKDEMFVFDYLRRLRLKGESPYITDIEDTGMIRISPGGFNKISTED